MCSHGDAWISVGTEASVLSWSEGHTSSLDYELSRYLQHSSVLGSSGESLLRHISHPLVKSIKPYSVSGWTRCKPFILTPVCVCVEVEGVLKFAQCIVNSRTYLILILARGQHQPSRHTWRSLKLLLVPTAKSLFLT